MYVSTIKYKKQQNCNIYIMMNCRHIIYGNYSRMHWKPLNGLNSVDMELHSIESELDWDDYELWVHGNILEGRDTRDVDLTLIGPYDPVIVQHYLDTIVRIGFEGGVYMDVKYLISGELFDMNQYNITKKEVVNTYATYSDQITVNGNTFKYGEHLFGLNWVTSKLPLRKTIGKSYSSPRLLFPST